MILAGISLAGGAISMIPAAVERAAWLGWLSLVPLFVSIRSSTTKWAAINGFLWGAGSLLVAFSTHRGLDHESVRAALGIAAVTTAYCIFGVQLSRMIGYRPLALALLWVLAEAMLHRWRLTPGMLAAYYERTGIFAYLTNAFGYVVTGLVVAFVAAILAKLVIDLRLYMPPVLSFEPISAAGAVHGVVIEPFVSASWAINSYPRPPPHGMAAI